MHRQSESRNSGRRCIGRPAHRDTTNRSRPKPTGIHEALTTLRTANSMCRRTNEAAERFDAQKDDEGKPAAVLGGNDVGQN